MHRHPFPVHATALTLACLTGCHRRPSPISDERPAASAASPDAADDTCVPVVVGTVSGRVDALAASGGRVFGVMRARGEIFAVDPGARSPRVLSASEHEPFAIVVRDQKPAWASASGLFGADASGANRRAILANPTISALAAGSFGLFIATRTPAAVWRSRWPSEETNTAILVHDVTADELVVGDSGLAWVSYAERGVYSYDGDAGAPRVVSRDTRKPHDLSASAGCLLWHEGEADLQAGRPPRAFFSDVHGASAKATDGAYDASNRYLLRTPRVYGAAECKRLEEPDFHRLDSGAGEAPVADDDRRWYWVEDAHDGSFRIVSAEKDRCCP